MAMPQELVQAWTAWDQKVSGTTFAVLKVLTPIPPPPLASKSPTITSGDFQPITRPPPSR